ncbi:MAG: Alpha-mannosidase, partial [Clostridia bacterium]|nr:Alpha-mannosidase [Clostridia bacterium]
MAQNISLLKKLKASPQSANAHRICCELDYLMELSKVNGGEYDEKINAAMDKLYDVVKSEGTITKSAMEEAESALNFLSQKAKEYTVICIGHAHIDMNWMWRFDETVAITLATFRTMLDLMNEYKDFTFGQSQASVYRIVEKYDPKMLEEIKKRIKEGRWEVTASTWVEPDKNMPNGESLSRHILYTKKYLSKLLGITEESLDMDFEPDTFGHSVNIPEILNQGGVKYYYHCRGFDSHTFYKWEAPSGKSVLVYREPRWYNDTIEEANYNYVPSFAEEHKIKKVLSVYGVGDHGGGATRKDIEKIITMNTWPLMPAFKFGTYHEFFKYIESLNLELPVIKDELNFIFTGCYTTQTRIKEANRRSEALLNEAELFNTLSSMLEVADYDNKSFEEAWRNVLFNHFHDILPGSGIVDTREYALGLAQETFALGTTRKNLALSGIANNINNIYLVKNKDNEKMTTSEGAGVGFGLSEFSFGDVSRGQGSNRVFTFFNPSAHARTSIVKVTVWDWDVELGKIKVYNCNGELLEHDIIEGQRGYWGHSYFTILVKVTVP